MRLALEGATVIDGLGSEPRDNATVATDGEYISAVGSTPSDSTTFDLTGCTLLPGLIEAHTHLGAVAILDADRVPAAVAAGRIFRHCERVLDAGFTTVRETGGLDGGVVAAVDQGLVRGPRIIPAGPIITQTGGHGDIRPAFKVLATCCHAHGHPGHPGLYDVACPSDGPDQVRAAARVAFMRGARFLKMCVTGGITSWTDSINDVQFTVEELRAAVMEAHNRHTYVTVHTHNNEGIKRALEAGVECFEHCTELDEDTAALIAEAGACVVPTLTIMHLYHENASFLPPEVIARAAGMAEKAVEATKVAHRVGLTVGSGADLIGPDQHKFGHELVLKSSVLSPMDAIVSATSVNARILRMSDRIGSIEVGKLADLVAVSGNPLEEPELFDDPDRVVLVVKNGQVVKNRLAA